MFIASEYQCIFCFNCHLAYSCNVILPGISRQANTDLREFVHAAVNTITCWALNDFETLEDVVTPFLVKVAPICPRLRWAQPCLNILARLDHEATINSSEGSKLISQVC